MPVTSSPAWAARRAVDEVYADLAGAGYPGRQPPYDAFWGARYAIVEDPDGNPVRLMSPIDAGLRHWPPAPPLPGRDGAPVPPGQPDPHEQTEGYELQPP